MPQITLEYTDNIVVKDLKPLVLRIHNMLVEKLPTKLPSCKTRIIKHDNYVIGDGDKNNAFVHLSIRILKGRTEEVKDSAAEEVAQYIRDTFTELCGGLDLQISVEVGELPIYVKT